MTIRQKGLGKRGARHPRCSTRVSERWNTVLAVIAVLSALKDANHEYLILARISIAGHVYHHHAGRRPESSLPFEPQG